MKELIVARTEAELADLVETGTLIAGGTDLLVQLRSGREADRLVDISNLQDAPVLVDSNHESVTLSAMAPLTRVIRAVDGKLPGLMAAMPLFGSLQIRNRATLGGNIANASPAADAIPPLVAAGANLGLRSGAGDRWVPLQEFITGPGATRLRPTEWIRTVRLPLPGGVEGFRKLGGRLAMSIAIVSLAWRWRRHADGRLSDVRIALGAVAPTVVRAVDAEQILEGNRPTPEVVRSAAASARTAVSPIDDVRASAWYREEMVQQLVEEALLDEQRTMP